MTSSPWPPSPSRFRMNILQASSLTLARVEARSERPARIELRVEVALAPTARQRSEIRLKGNMASCSLNPKKGSNCFIWVLKIAKHSLKAM